MISNNLTKDGDFNAIKEKIRILNPELIKARRHLHSNPELSNMEFMTMDYISDYLKSLGVNHRTKVANTGIVADIKGTDDKFTVAFRADMDALPIEDLKKCGYSSKNKGVCHACGHDAHTAINMGIANIFSEKTFPKISPPCNVRLIFQPAEETVGGALPMIRENALEGVNIIYALHVSPNIDTGYMQINDSVVNAGCSDFIIKVYGKSSHGANPSNGVDAILIASNIINNMQFIVSRNVDASDGAVITVGTVKGGTATNVICDYVELTGTIRAFKEKTMENIKNIVKKTVKHIANSMNGEAEFIETVYFAALVNWKDASYIARENAINLLGKEKVLELKPSLGAEDFSFFVRNKPGAFFNIGVRNVSKGIVHKVHNGLFDIDEEAIGIGLTLQIANLYGAYSNRELFPLGRSG